MLTAIRSWVIKTMMKNQTGVVQTLPKREIIELNTQITAERFMRNGINPESMKTVDQVENVINQINQLDTPKVKVDPGIPSIKKADVLDMEGNKIPEGSGIMGGKAVKESDAAIKARIERQNIEAAERLKEKQKQTMDDMKEIEDPEEFADGGRIGYFLGSSKFPKGLATLREMVKFFSKGKEKERSGSEILKMVNPKQFNKLLEDPSIYKKFDVEKGIGAPELIKNMQADMTKNRTMMVEEILNAAKNIKKADEGTLTRKKELVNDMIERGIDKSTAGEMADTIVRMAETTAGVRATPKLTDEGILQLENILKNMETGGKPKRDLNADGGRIGLKDGMNRRTFLKLLGGLAAIPIVGKIFKPLKTVKGIKNVPIIKTGEVPGKPEWFDTLVNKVILEGDDVTKKFATKEREIVHSKKLDDDTSVTVTQDLDDGVVRVEYNSPENMYGDPVQMQYKKGIADEVTKRKPADEFQTSESVPVARADDPDDFNIDIDEGGGTSISDLTSDVSKLKQYATGQKPKIKEIVQIKKRKDKAKAISEGDRDAEFEFMEKRQGQPFYDPPEPDFASGGIARMLGE